MFVDTITVEEVAGIPDFPTYAEGFLTEGMKTLVPSELTNLLVKQGMPKEMAEAQAQELANTEVAPGTGITLGSIISDALVQHYTGDEKANPVTDSVVMGLQNSEDPMHQFLGNALYSLYNDDTPDNEFVIDLNSLNK
ncbi:hypothetical protein D7X33_26950 [Butyricicoccus sp. 1XD8-22]|nr:hypothetical protein D7X33_26950 [Butyricicoccus sp. 1XD8-22]